MQEGLEPKEPNALETADSKEPEVISSLEVLKIIFSRQTSPHTFLLILFLFTLGIFSRESERNCLALDLSKRTLLAVLRIKGNIPYNVSGGEPDPILIVFTLTPKRERSGAFFC